MNQRNFTAVLLLAATSLTAASAPGVAVAAEGDATLTRVVSYADLNLATPAGRRSLERRLITAARNVCAPLDGSGLRQRAAWRECVAQALAGAREALPTTALAARAAR